MRGEVGTEKQDGVIYIPPDHDETDDIGFDELAGMGAGTPPKEQGEGATDDTV